MSEEFRFLNLPIIPIHLILRSMDFKEKFKFSLCSKKNKFLLKSLRFPITITIGIHDTEYINVDHKQVQLKFGKSMRYGREFEKRIIDGFAMRIRTKNRELTISASRKQPRLPLAIVLEHLFNIFIVSITRIFLNFDHFSDSHYQIFSGSSQIFKNPVHGLIVCAREKPIQEEWLKDYIQNVQVSENLTVDLPVSYIPSFNSENRIFSLSGRLRSGNAKWMSPTTFINSDCAELVLFNPNFTPDVYENFVSKWLNSGSTRLDYVQCLPKPRYELSNFDRFPTKPWDKTQRAKDYIIPDGGYMDCSEGLDIVRSDGMLATIVDSMKAFYFVVWKNRFPVSRS